MGVHQAAVLDAFDLEPEVCEVEALAQLVHAQHPDHAGHGGGGGPDVIRQVGKPEADPDGDPGAEGAHHVHRHLAGDPAVEQAHAADQHRPEQPGHRAAGSHSLAHVVQVAR